MAPPVPFVVAGHRLPCLLGLRCWGPTARGATCDALMARNQGVYTAVGTSSTCIKETIINGKIILIYGYLKSLPVHMYYIQKYLVQADLKMQ